MRTSERWPRRWAADPEAAHLARLAHAEVPPLDEANRSRVLRAVVERGRRDRQRVPLAWPLAAAAAVTITFAGVVLHSGALDDSPPAEPRGARASSNDVRAQTDAARGGDMEVRGDMEVHRDGRWGPLEARSALPARVRLQDGPPATITLGRGARIRVEPGAELEVAAEGLRIARGAVTSEVEPGHGAYHVQLGRYAVRVTGTVFWTARDGETATVCVEEGSVQVSRGDRRLATLAAGQGWRSGAAAPGMPSPCEPRETAVEALEPAAPGSAPSAMVPASARRRRSRLEAVARETTADACDHADAPEVCWRALAAGRGLPAETALYRLGRWHARQERVDPALQAWSEHAQRFPTGALAEEVALARLELELRHRPAAAMASAEAFLARHGSSAQAAEVRVIRGTLRHRAGECAGALDDYRSALAAGLRSRRREEALIGRGACSEVTGRAHDAVEAYRDYLTDYSTGRFADRARQRLDALDPTP